MFYIIRTETGYEVCRYRQLVADCNDLDAALTVVGNEPYTQVCAAAWRMQP